MGSFAPRSCADVIQFMAWAVLATQQRGARRRTIGCGRVRLVENHALGGELINVGGLEKVRAHVAGILPAEIIQIDEKNVGRIRFCSRRAADEREQDYAPERGCFHKGRVGRGKGRAHRTNRLRGNEESPKLGLRSTPFDRRDVAKDGQVTTEGSHHPQVNDCLGPGVNPPWQRGRETVDGGDQALSFGKESKLETSRRVDGSIQNPARYVEGLASGVVAGERGGREFEQRDPVAQRIKTQGAVFGLADVDQPAETLGQPLAVGIRDLSGRPAGRQSHALDGTHSPLFADGLAIRSLRDSPRIGQGSTFRVH